MKVLVIKEDESVIYNGRIYGFGETFEVDEEIGKSLAERGYVSCEADVEDEASLQTGYLDEAQLQEVPYTELKKLAASMGLSASGNKETLINKIIKAQSALNEEDADDLTDIQTDVPDTGMPE